MSDRWSRAGERSRKRADELQRRYRRGGAHRSTTDEWDDYEDDDTAVIPRYVDEDEQVSHYAEAAPGYGGAHHDPGYGAPHDPGYAEADYVDPDYAAEDTDPGYGRARRGHRYREDEYDSAADLEPVAVEEPPAPPVRRTTRNPRAAAAARSLREARRETTRKTAGKSPAKSTRSAGKSTRSGSSGRGRSSRVASRKAAERQRRRRNVIVLGCVFVVLFVVAGGYAGYKFIRSMGGPEDFDGPPGPLAVVQVHSGDTAEQIAQTMQDKGVVKSTGAFYQAAVRSSGITSVQPGYYAVPTHSKGTDAVAALLNKSSRVGNVVVSEGRRLHDSTDVNTGARNEGIYRKIADASCVGTGAAKKCVTYEQLDAAGSSPNLAALGVPAWAMDAVRKVPDRSRQLEGLIAAGTWDFDPSGTPEQILAQLVGESAASYETTGLLQSGATNKLDPYHTLIAASLVEREALPQDMTKVARVIVNRLAVDQPLQLDSTVNYTLDRTELATTDADRARKTPWNTYAMAGLPATPISSPSLDALRAMENPTPGPWLYFVTIDKQGTTLFTESYSEHLRNIQRAQQSGILDSGR
ncbi:endolytic transglycosylase MltG [Nocardia veterana]|uniref:Endolytic murein transglycosylase n=1 Tax=Nocardia veterana TaxID=132249 RepID=A0A7X6RIS1_9NOCA|nr:endolytic transglycosylase MltG [Nocardia veterana]NKY86963.1 endolytic transglycosylase MltG [Nocardia veterana]